MYLRPCFLVVDREFAGSVSSRKLVLETAKFNVITAYSFDEGAATLDRYPNLQAAVVTGDAHGNAEKFLRWMRAKHPGVKAVVTGSLEMVDGLADATVESFAPAKLLSILRELFPEDARTSDAIESQLEAQAGE